MSSCPRPYRSFHRHRIVDAVIKAIRVVLQHGKNALNHHRLQRVFNRCLVLTSTMLSGPPGTQNKQLSGTELNRKCFCFSPGSSGIMKPWMRWLLLVERHHRR